MADARRQRWQAHRQARRAQFVDAAIRAVGERGPDIGMDDIAATAGITKPVLYRHFVDKADLYRAVGEQATATLMARVLPALAADGPIVARIRGAVDHYLAFVEEYQQLYRFLVLRPNPAGPQLVAQDKATIAAALTDILGGYLRLFRMDDTLAGPVAHGIVGLVHGAGEWWLDHLAECPRDRLSDQLTLLIWHGLDGILRAGGVVVDPHQPLSAASQRRLAAAVSRS